LWETRAVSVSIEAQERAKRDEQEGEMEDSLVGGSKVGSDTDVLDSSSETDEGGDVGVRELVLARSGGSVSKSSGEELDVRGLWSSSASQRKKMKGVISVCAEKRGQKRWSEGIESVMGEGTNLVLGDLNDSSSDPVRKTGLSKGSFVERGEGGRVEVVLEVLKGESYKNKTRERKKNNTEKEKDRESRSALDTRCRAQAAERRREEESSP
jgi:hypothetical protein